MERRCGSDEAEASNAKSRTAWREGPRIARARLSQTCAAQALHPGYALF
jgi:hypothetical protein